VKNPNYHTAASGMVVCNKSQCPCSYRMTPCHDILGCHLRCGVIYAALPNYHTAASGVISLVVAWFRHIDSMGEKVGLKIISRYSFILVNYFKKMLKNTNCDDAINEYEKCVPCINICVVLSEKLLLLAAF